jgi:hypothetical protein
LIHARLTKRIDNGGCHGQNSKNHDHPPVFVDDTEVVEEVDFGFLAPCERSLHRARARRCSFFVIRYWLFVGAQLKRLPRA